MTDEYGGKWIRYPESSTVLIFIHGLFSSGASCWGSDKSSWLDIAGNDPAIKDAGIYVFNYPTSLKAADFSIRDATDGLIEYMKLDSVLKHSFLVFVAHSMGGIVARNLLAKCQFDFMDHANKLGYFLIASPSMGARYADWFKALGLFHNEQIDTLSSTPTNTWLRDLDRDFRDIREGQRLEIVGRELIEDVPMSLPASFWGSLFNFGPVVPAEAAARYFGHPLKIAGSDHSSIAKPLNDRALQHRTLVDFVVRHRLPTEVGPASPPPLVPTRIPIYIYENFPIVGSVFVGRELELKTIRDAITDDRVNIVTIVAMGGTGKTAIVKRLFDELREREWKPFEGVFCWSFDSQGNKEESRHSAVERFYAAAFAWLGETKNIPATRSKRAQTLADLFSRKRFLLVLDGVEPLQFSHLIKNGELRDKTFGTFLRVLSERNPGVCVVTSRQHIFELRDITSSVKVLNLAQLEDGDAIQLLKSKGVVGTDANLTAAVGELKNHALSLSLLGGLLYTQFHGDVEQRSKLKFDELFTEAELGERAEFVMAAYERRFAEGAGRQLEHSLLLILGLFDRPAPGGALRALLSEPPIRGLTERYLAMTVQERAQNYKNALRRLRTLDLLAPPNPHQKDDLDAHPLVRAYFGSRLKTQNAHAWSEAHERLAAYYEALIPAKPRKPHELDAAFYAIGHACKAGQIEHAYKNLLTRKVRNARGVNDERLVDHSSLVAVYSNFFEHLWSKPIQSLDDKKKQSLLKAASFSLKACGQQKDALDALEGLLDNLSDNEGKAIISRRAAEICTNLGLLNRAESLANDSIKYADSTKRHGIRSATRATYADILHQRGKFEKSKIAFQSATDIFRSVSKPGTRWITAEQGYKFAEYLLTVNRKTELTALTAQMLGERNALDAPDIFKGYYHLVSALNGFGTPGGSLQNAYQDTELAGEYFSNAEAVEYMARALRLGAMLLRLQGDCKGARRDLQEAFYLATTYDLRLIYVDCLLERVEILIAENATKKDVREAFEAANSIIAEAGYEKRNNDVERLKLLV